MNLTLNHSLHLQEGYIAESLSDPLSSLGYLLIFTSVVMALIWTWPQGNNTHYYDHNRYDYGYYDYLSRKGCKAFFTKSGPLADQSITTEIQ